MQHINGNFENVVQSAKPTVVCFWGTTCKACKVLLTTLQSLEPEFSGLQFVGVNVEEDANIPIATRYGISALPTLLLFRNGSVREQLIGAVNVQRLRAFLKAS